MKKQRMLWYFLNGSFSFPFHARSRREYFSDIHCESLTELLDMHITEVWSLPMTEAVPLEFEPSDLSTLSLHQLVCYSSDSLTQALVPAEASVAGRMLWLSYDSPDSRVCFSNIRDISFPCDLTSLPSQRRAVDCFFSIIGLKLTYNVV